MQACTSAHLCILAAADGAWHRVKVLARRVDGHQRLEEISSHVLSARHGRPVVVLVGLHSGAWHKAAAQPSACTLSLQLPCLYCHTHVSSSSTIASYIAALAPPPPTSNKFAPKHSNHAPTPVIQQRNSIIHRRLGVARRTRDARQDDAQCVKIGVLNVLTQLPQLGLFGGGVAGCVFI